MSKTRRRSVRIVKPAGGGAYGDVYKGACANGEIVAVKLIRRSVGDTAFTLEQAEALRIVQSRYVVKVLSIEPIKDPETGKLVHAIIMEWIEGKPLERVVRKTLPLKMARRIGLSLIRGLKAIHDAELVHGDLHGGNVLVSDHHVKIIDILYRYTLAKHSTESKERRYQRDRNSLRVMLSEILTSADIGLDEVDAFSRALSQKSTFEDIREQFDLATDTERRIDSEHELEKALAAVRDESFVDSDSYAEALTEEIPNPIVRPLIDAMIANGLSVMKHKTYLKLLWNRIGEEDQGVVGVQLSAAIDREVPQENWLPHLIMLQNFGLEGWKALRKATRLRLEKAIAADILNGRHDFYSPITTGKWGNLGRWTKAFYRRFTNKPEILDNIIEQLQRGWNCQNYIGTHFIPYIATIPLETSDKERLIKAINRALRDTPFVLQNRIKLLPKDWRDEILTT